MGESIGSHLWCIVADPSAAPGTAFYVRLPFMGWTSGSRLWGGCTERVISFCSALGMWSPIDRMREMERLPSVGDSQGSHPWG